ncbi:hypothetical protein K466DRAFT_510485 [Polyporus arcularius HHB13444]|uniref:MYND-type domain-containing protein n=1 Tax=Polyporus arcularius HHB13444 TaxID=1314778 RepID=A0A5C3PX61_9APHY|nr:hypothetical protein K466DRAFT_510485 [Polyporus arcularius HHB13444]
MQAADHTSPTSSWQREWRRGQVRARPRTRHKYAIKHQCSYCSKSSDSALPCCPICKSVRYCNKECQKADYAARHKQDCAEFADPPFTTDFLTVPIENQKYPRNPIIGQDHEEGVGVWVSIRTSQNCELQLLANPKRFTKDSKAKLPGDPGITREDLAKYKAHASNLLTLQVLVQNRRKDGEKALVFGAQSRVISYGNTMDELMRGKTSVLVESVTDFKIEQDTYAVIPVARDPWDKKPRLFIKNFNGTELHANDPLPPAVKNADRGIVELAQGEYVILQMQYRVGDGVTIAKDMQALHLLQALTIPVVQPLPESAPEERLAHLLDIEFTREQRQEDADPLGIRVAFDQDVIQEYFRDYVDHGERAYIASHYGPKGLELWEMRVQEMERKGRAKLEELIQAGGNVPGLIAYMRSAGMNDEAFLLENALRDSEQRMLLPS